MSAPPLVQRPRLYGMLFALLAAFGFSFKAILVKLAYAWQPVDAITLLALRMLFALPFFVAIAWHARGGQRTRMAADDWLRLTWLGLTGYYLASILDFWSCLHQCRLGTPLVLAGVLMVTLPGRTTTGV